MTTQTQVKKTREELIEGIKARFTEDEREFPLDIGMDWEDINMLFWQLQNEDGLTNFSVVFRSTEDDAWLQAEYFSPKLRHTIIVDYDYKGEFESAEELADAILETEKEIEKIESLIINE